MKLSDEDGQLFYELWLPLLDYVNKKYKINKKLKNIAGAKKLEPAEVKKIANKLWDNVEIIDEYLKEQNSMPEENKKIIKSWKHCVQGCFVMERHLKKGTIFISLDNGKVYQVQGIISTWEEMFPFVPLPLLIEATFIPFRDVIISDGLVMPYNISMERNMAAQFKDIYMNAKKSGTLIRSLSQNDFENASKEEKDLQKQRWKKFSKLTSKCYSNMIGANEDNNCWVQAFELLKEIALEEKKENPHLQLETLDDITDYAYDIQGWLEDCLDEIDMSGNSEILLDMCNDLLDIFEWPEYTGSDIKFRKCSVLGNLRRKEEAEAFCKGWLEREPENIVAATAGVYVFMDIKKLEAAEKLVELFIDDKSECTEENDIMFTAASKLYQVMGKRKEKKQIDKALREYEGYLKKYFMGMDDEDEEMEFWDEDLPF